MSGNQALVTNANYAGNATLQITNNGSDWYFTVCAIMTVSSLIFMGHAMTMPRTHRLFHYMTAGITFVAAIAYFSMGSGLGATATLIEFPRAGGSQMEDAAYPSGTREIFYARYIDWFITTPLLLLDLLLTAGVPAPTIAVTILADEIMVVTGLVGALIPSSYKWGYWLFGTLAFFFVFYQLAVVGRAHSKALSANVHSTFMKCGVLTLFIWCLYPLAWGLCEGGNVLNPDSEAYFYGVLDVIAKPVFGFLLIAGHRNIDPAELGLNIHDPSGSGLPTEKKSNGFFGNNHAAGTDGPTNTTTTNTV